MGRHQSQLTRSRRRRRTLEKLRGKLFIGASKIVKELSYGERGRRIESGCSLHPVEEKEENFPAAL